MKEIKNFTVISLAVLSILTFLKRINVLQPSNGFGTLKGMVGLFIISVIVIYVINHHNQKNYEVKKINYDNLDVMRYVSSILIVILHLRPFFDTSEKLDLVFNNIIGRICVPFFFLLSGYFIGEKERKNNDYILKYVKSMIPLYLMWSILYLPVFIYWVQPYFGEILLQIRILNLPIWFICLLIPLILPIVLLVMLVYSGTFYHLWYFPALILSLLILYFWKKKYSLKVLLFISFILLLLGATETYYGVLPNNIQIILNYYFKYFITTRNFLFFGLFYVVFGYYISFKQKIYVSQSFLKLIVFSFLLIFETLILQSYYRLNSNILLSCILLVYYLFLTLIFSPSLIHKKFKYSLRGLSKYYYLIHPFVIMVVQHLFSELKGFLAIVLVLVLTHLLTLLVIKIKEKYPRLSL